MTEQEITQTWNDYYPKVFGYFYRRLSNHQDVEDLTSISLSAFINKIADTSIVMSHQNAYLWRICHNQLSTYIHVKTKAPVAVPYDENWVPKDTSLEAHQSKEFTSRMESLRNCINKNVNQDDATIIEMSYIEGHSSDHIAQELDLKSATVRKRLSRAISTIRQTCNNLWLHYS